MKTFAWIVSLIFCCLADLIAAPSENFLLFEDTTSPDGSYALAWGLSDQRVVNWKKLGAGDEKEFERLGDFDDVIENYVIDLHSRAIVKKLSSDYWAIPGGLRANHQGFQAVWAKRGDLVIVCHSAKWSFISLNVERLEAGKSAASLKIGPALEQKCLSYMAAKFPVKYRQSKERLGVGFNEMTSLGGLRFRIESYAEVPKGREDELQAEVAMEIEIAELDSGQLSLKSVEFRPIARASSDGDAEAALIAADQRLNSAYAKLRGQLSNAQREALKRAQLTWLKARDQVSDPAKRAAFIDARTAELESTGQ